MLLFFAGRLIGVDKHLFRRVSLTSMTLPLNYIFVLLLAKLSIKSRQTGIPTQQVRETRAPWTDTSVFGSHKNLLLKLDNLGFQPSKQGRQELPGLILQSLVVKT